MDGSLKGSFDIHLGVLGSNCKFIIWMGNLLSRGSIVVHKRFSTDGPEFVDTLWKRRRRLASRVYLVSNMIDRECTP